jgi:hypothetical protein
LFRREERRRRLFRASSFRTTTVEEEQDLEPAPEPKVRSRVVREYNISNFIDLMRKEKWYSLFLAKVSLGTCVEKITVTFPTEKIII